LTQYFSFYPGEKECFSNQGESGGKVRTFAVMRTEAHSTNTRKWLKFQICRKTLTYKRSKCLPWAGRWRLLFHSIEAHVQMGVYSFLKHW